MDDGEDRARSLRIRFRSPADAAGETALRDALGTLSPPPLLRFSEQSLDIEYPFPVLTMAEIWPVLAASEPASQFATGCRLRCRVLAFLELNERERLQQPRGWQQHAREIHAQYFDRRRSRAGDARRQQWRKHEKRNKD